MGSTTELLLPSPSLTISLSSPGSSSRSSLSSPCRHLSSYRMPAPSKNSCPTSPSLNHLSSELLSLVFEQLQHLDPQTLCSIRLVSRRFDAIATPIAFGTLVLNEKIVAPGAERRYANAYSHVSAYTKHVVIRSDLDLHGIRRVLAHVRRLSSIRWRYMGPGLYSGDLWLPSDVLDLGQMRSRRVKLHVEDLPLREFHGEQRDSYIHAIPGDLLASLKLAHPEPALTTRLGSLKRLLTRAPNLESLYYQDRGQGTSFSFATGERLPALTHLHLKSYNWNHSTYDVCKHWDFSRIKCLELISVPIYNFLKSVDFNDFTALNTLRIEDYSAHLADRRQEATANLYLLIKNHVRALEFLDITCHTHLFPIDAILAHQRSLQALRLRDHAGFGEDDRRCPTLWAGDLALLAKDLSHVHTLELDMDIRQCDPAEFMRAICAFRSLHTLTLHVQTVIHAHEVVPPGVDRDYDAAMRTLSFLVHVKQQAPVHTSWRRIVINVGGWKRVMVRRLSSAWRRQNDNGIFAERCFVLEKKAEGEMVMHEEMCTETSRRTTPEP